MEHFLTHRGVPVVTPADRPYDQESNPSLVIGREREQQTLRDALDAMLAGRGRVVLVGGEAGIGKTTLVEWLAGEARRSGCLVLSGGCYDLTMTPPYGPWLELIARYRPDGDLPPVPAFVHDAEALRGLGSQNGLFRGAVSFFLEIAAGKPLMLVVEDLHWADQASLEFLRVLARSVAEHPILLVVTFRDDELTRRHALYQLLPSVVRESRAERLALRRLDDDWLRGLINGRYDLPPGEAERLVAHLREQSEGNPFFAVELLRSLEEEGLLAWAPSGWALVELRDIRVPALVRQVIERRLSRLDEAVRPLLEVAAVIGQVLPLELWQQAAGASDDDLIAALEAAMRAQVLVEIERGAALTFTHALVREALYEGVIPLRRRRLHRQIGEMLAQGARPDPDEVAFHLQQAHDPRAAGWLISAAQRAASAFALSAAAERYEAAQALLEQDDTHLEQRGWLLYQLATATRFTRTRQCLDYLEEAEQIASVIGNPVLRIVVQAERGFVLDQGDHVLQTLTAALNAYDAMSPEAWRAGAAGYEALFLAGDQQSRAHPGQYLARWMEARRQTIVVLLAALGRCQEALDLAEPWWSYWETTVRPWSVVNALGGAGSAHAALGDPGTARSMWRRATDICLPLHNHIVAGLNFFREIILVHLPYDTDDLAERRALNDGMLRQYTQAAEYGNALIPPARLYAYPLRFLEGAWADAEHAATTFTGMSNPHPLIPAYAHYILGMLAYHRGNANAAWAEVNAAFPAGPSTEPGDSLFLESQMLQRLAVGLALDGGDLTLARAWLEAHDRWLSWSGAVRGRAESALLWAQYHAAAGSAPARQQGEQALVLASDPRQPLVLIAAHRFLGQLDSADRRFADAEVHLDVSLALADACAAPFERALTLLVLAELRAAQGRVAEARELLAEARSICEPLAARPTLERIEALEHRLTAAAPPRPQGDTFPGGLTAREIEVLRLVAEGLTDAEAAERLFISPRTVGQHLRSVYNKLGVSSRTAAAILAKERNIV
jgi:DNA-binding CsgD family transcriptional regulator